MLQAEYYHVKEAVLDNLAWTLYPTIPLAALLAWRLWTFTIRPALKPEEPPFLPYWVPFLGHAVAFFRDSNDLYERGCAHFNPTPTPHPRTFQLLIVGQPIAIVLSDHTASQILKQPSNYTYDPYITHIYRTVANVSPRALSILWRTPSQGSKSLQPNPSGKCLVHLGNALLHKQLLDPTRLDDLTHKVLSHIDAATHWDSLPATSILASNSDVKILSLHNWCRDVLVTGQNRAFFGDSLREIEPRVAELLDEWNVHNWRVLYPYPRFMAREATRPRDRLIEVLRAYLEGPVERRGDGVPFVGELGGEERAAGLAAEDSARILLIILWGINANIQMTAFWTLAHILTRPPILSQIRTEITPHMQSLDRAGPSLPSLAKTALTDPARCPLLNSSFNEVLRHTSTGRTVRDVVKSGAWFDSPDTGNDTWTTQAGGTNKTAQTSQTSHPTQKPQTLPPGTKIFMPTRPSLTSSSHFGDDAADVDLRRFARDAGLDGNRAFRVFGRGSTMCSGRLLGRREVLGFVAGVVWRFEVGVLGVDESPGRVSGKVEGDGTEAVLGVRGKPFPRLDVGKPSLGVAKQIEGDDLIVRVRRRV